MTAGRPTKFILRYWLSIYTNMSITFHGQIFFLIQVRVTNDLKKNFILLKVYREEIFLSL